LSYWEETADAWGGSSGPVSVKNRRCFVLTGPAQPVGSTGNVRITRYSPEVRWSQVATEATFLAALTAFLVWTLGVSRKRVKSGLRSGGLLAQIALLVYMVSLPLPAIEIAATPATGWQAFMLSFLGAWSAVTHGGSGLERGQASACLIGAGTNLLFALSHIGLTVCPFLPADRRPNRQCTLMACLAAAGTLGSLIPLMFGSEDFSVSIGYVLWVVSAAILALAAVRQESAHVP
jgi:hypothetical protein